MFTHRTSSRHHQESSDGASMFEGLASASDLPVVVFNYAPFWCGSWHTCAAAASWAWRARTTVGFSQQLGQQQSMRTRASMREDQHVPVPCHGYMHVKLLSCCFRCRWWSCNWWCKHPDSKEEQSHITIAGPFSSEEVRPVMLASMVTNQLYCVLESRSSCVSTVLGSNATFNV